MELVVGDSMKRVFSIIPIGDLLKIKGNRGEEK